MEIVTTGRVIVPARIENLQDIHLADKGALPAGQIRVIEVPDALVDRGATLLSMPPRLINELGLKRHRTCTSRTSAGTIQFGVFDAVRLTVQERDCIIEVAEVPEECAVLIGRVPLGLLDFVVDSAGHRLIGNPEHGGERMIDMF